MHLVRKRRAWGPRRMLVSRFRLGKGTLLTSASNRTMFSHPFSTLDVSLGYGWSIVSNRCSYEVLYEYSIDNKNDGYRSNRKSAI